jgi:acyl transferase domain-containing protein
MACESLRRGECKVAVAGGVNLSLHPSKYIKLSQDRYLSSDGKCRSFGEGGDGFVPGEGVGAVILKPFDAAKRDRDNIYAVIKGVAENHGGKTKGFTVPNPDIQAELIMDAIEDSGIHPKTISYIEAHGTGTALGDPIEIAGLTKAFDRYTSNKQFCPVGSCKSNFGHLEAASGLIALTKVLLMMKHKKLVPSLHCEKLNPNIDFKETPFYVQQELSDWKRPEFLEDGKNKVYPRRAGISSFGAGGSNAHIILEEWDEEEDSTITQRNTEKQVLIILSAKDRDRLKEYVLRFRKFIELQMACNEEKVKNMLLKDIAYTLQVGREGMEERMAVIAGSMEELIEKLNAYLNNENQTINMFTGTKKTNTKAISDEQKIQIFSLFQNGRYEEIASMWTAGCSIDWESLYKETGWKNRRISLPTYPFARECY